MIAECSLDGLWVAIILVSFMIFIYLLVRPTL